MPKYHLQPWRDKLLISVEVVSVLNLFKTSPCVSTLFATS